MHTIPFPSFKLLHILPFVILMAFQFAAKGQNYFMLNDQSGAHANAEIAYNSFENFYAIYPGYTFNGRLTLGLGIGKNKDVVNKINSTLFRPYVSYLIIKQNEEYFPVSIDLNIGYQYNYVTQVIFNSRSVLFGGGIFHEITPLGNVKIIPAVVVNGSKPTSGPNTQFRETVVMSYGVQTSLVWNDYNLTPKFSLSEGIATISANLGIIF